jgi:hypothetical protein
VEVDCGRVFDLVVGWHPGVFKESISILFRMSRQGIEMSFNVNGAIFTGASVGWWILHNRGGRRIGWVYVCHRTIHKLDDICLPGSLFCKIEHRVIEPRRFRLGFSYDP